MYAISQAVSVVYFFPCVYITLSYLLAYLRIFCWNLDIFHKNIIVSFDTYPHFHLLGFSVVSCLCIYLVTYLGYFSEVHFLFSVKPLMLLLRMGTLAMPNFTLGWECYYQGCLGLCLSSNSLLSCLFRHHTQLLNNTNCHWLLFCFQQCSEA